MLQHRAVAGHQRRGDEAEHLPEREIPRHDRQHDADRVEGDEHFGTAEVDRLVGKIGVGVLGEPVAMERAFLDLGPAFVEGLAHLVGHQPRRIRPALAEDSRRPCE